MPHQCVRCNTFYEDGAKEILSGCTCGGRLFFYIKKGRMEEARQMVTNLNEDQKQEMEKDVFDLVGAQPDNEPVVLEFESISVLKPGKYQLDLVHLFKNEPLVIKLGDGKYILDLAETFKKSREGQLK
jgi:predicted  nucleic acid-binding Zn-ribbon protein